MSLLQAQQTRHTNRPAGKARIFGVGRDILWDADAGAFDGSPTSPLILLYS
jgi:hypothetical protein